MESCKQAFRAMVEAREGVSFDVESLNRLMECFQRLCTEDCGEGKRDVDSSCRKCEE